MPSISIYSEDILGVIDTIEKKLYKYKNNTVSNNAYITIYKFIYQKYKNADLKDISEINEDESRLTRIPKQNIPAHTVNLFIFILLLTLIKTKLKIIFQTGGLMKNKIFCYF